MKLIKFIPLSLVFFLFSAQTSKASDDFYGVIEQIPEGNIGTWVIGGRSVEVTETTSLEEDDGPFVVGACVQVDYNNGVVEEIETEEQSKCAQ
jgi:hypothetical protein